MPHVQITWVEGRTPEQKRKIAERITNVLIEDGRAKRENIHVAFQDVPATNYAEAGVFVADQKRPPWVASLSRLSLLHACRLGFRVAARPHLSRGGITWWLPRDNRLLAAFLSST